MQIIRDYKNIPKDAKASVIALGNFDGIHKGHQAVIKTVVEMARESNTPAAIMTFSPHPVKLFNPNAENFLLTSEEKKIELLEAMGIDYLFIINFTDEFSNIKAEEFIKDILVDSLAVKHVIIGYDFIFGKKRKGNANMLREKSAIYGYSFAQARAEGENDEIFSSTKIRTNIKLGKLGKVKAMLGRNYSVAGFVEKGDERGKGLGFPTINVNVGDLLLAKSGVYAVNTLIDGAIYKSVANIGKKPTFGQNETSLEVHIFDFNRDIYGANVEIEFISYIREEEKFADIEQLKAQISADCLQVKEILTVNM